MIKNQQERGVVMHTWSDEMLNTFNTAWDEVVIEQSQDATFDTVYKDLAEFRKNYDVWAQRAFIPRT